MRFALMSCRNRTPSNSLCLAYLWLVQFMEATRHERQPLRLLQKLANQLEDIRLRSFRVVESWCINQNYLVVPEAHVGLLDPDSRGCQLIADF